jgi:hypothetical protein
MELGGISGSLQWKLSGTCGLAQGPDTTFAFLLMKEFSLLFSCLFLTSVLLGTNQANTAEGALQSIGEWVQTQRILSEENARWRQDKALLTQSILLLEEEAQLLGARIEDWVVSNERSARDRRVLVAEIEQFRAGSAEAEELVTRLQSALEDLRPMLPRPLQARTEPLFARFGLAGGRPDDFAPRLQAVVGILGEVNRFQKNVTLAREAMEVEEGVRWEVRTLYLGLGQAFFVDKHERVAGVGRPGLDGWEWARNDGLASSVGRAVAVIEGRRPAEFIQLPVEVAP